RPADAATCGEYSRADSGLGRDPHPDRCLRGLPHRSARGRRGAERAQASAGSRAPDRRSRDWRGGRGRALPGRRPRGRPVARLGLYGFGAAAHIVCQVALHEGRRVFAFVRGGDDAAREFALELGAEWAGDSLSAPPEELDAAIIFAPAGELVPAALRVLAKGG